MSCEHASVVPWKDCGTCTKCGEDGICDACLYGRQLTDPKTYVLPLHKCPEEIRICEDCCSDIDVPLVWTFAFNGAEYWCPRCGKSSGMLGASRKVEWSEKLQHRLDKYKNYTKPYLNANSSLGCSQLYWNGEWISPRDLPKEELARLQEICKNGWKAGIDIL